MNRIYVETRLMLFFENVGSVFVLYIPALNQQRNPSHFQQVESHPQWDQLEEETQGDEENSDVSDFTTDDEDSND